MAQKNDTTKHNIDQNQRQLQREKKMFMSHNVSHLTPTHGQLCADLLLECGSCPDRPTRSLLTAAAAWASWAMRH